MPADIIIYAVVAAGLVFWLRSILGTRHGEERERPNPFAQTEERTEKPADNPDKAGAAEIKPMSREETITSLGKTPGSVFSIENKTAENALLDLAEKDPGFDINFFMTGAQEAFTMIVEAFASGDRETLRELLSDDVYKAFEGSIREREERGEIMETRIHGIRKSQIIETTLEDDQMAFITLRFEADETSVIKDAEGNILEGDPDKASEMIDIWTFGRDISSDDPRWLLYQTRSDDPDDNDMVPNTD